jgi:hypothetical protein
MSEHCNKRKRNNFDLAFKIRVCNICRKLNIHEASVRIIKKNAENIRGSVASTSNTALKRISKCHELSIENSEKALAIWIDEMAGRNIAITTRIVQEKAREFHGKLSGDKNAFKAMNGWFDRFKKRYSLHNVIFFASI